MSTGSDPHSGSAGDAPLVRCTIAEAAGRLGISKRAVMRQIQKGALAAEREGGQWVVMLPGSPYPAEGESAPDQIASGSLEEQAAGPLAGGLLAGPNDMRQVRPQDQIERAIERLGEQHSVRLRALSEQIRRHASSHGTKHPSSQTHAGPFERQLEAPAQPSGVVPEQDAPIVDPPAASSWSESSVAPHEPLMPNHSRPNNSQSPNNSGKRFSKAHLLRPHILTARQYCRRRAKSLMIARRQLLHLLIGMVGVSLLVSGGRI